jgi:predicted RNase H-like HicB family nuclease
MTNLILVHASFDNEANIWYIHHSTLQGLHVEGATFEELRQEVKYAVESLLDGKTNDVSIETIAHSHDRFEMSKAA